MDTRPPRKTKRRRWRRFPTVPLLALLAAVLLWRLSLVPKVPPPLVIHVGGTVGAVHFPDGDTVGGGIGQPVDHLACTGGSHLAGRFQVHLSLDAWGRAVAIPAGIGITPPRTVRGGTVTRGACAYGLRTRDATGLIDVATRSAATLGDFFDIWGEALSSSDVAGFRGPVRAFVNGRPFEGVLRGLVLRPREEITLEVGTPVEAPRAVVFPGR